jgi:hypothetical protein
VLEVMALMALNKVAHQVGKHSAAIFLVLCFDCCYAMCLLLIVSVHVSLSVVLEVTALMALNKVAHQVGGWKRIVFCCSKGQQCCPVLCCAAMSGWVRQTTECILFCTAGC